MNSNVKAESLVGKYVRFAHLPAELKPTPIRVIAATNRGMVLLKGWEGEFASHLFVVVEGPKEAVCEKAALVKP